MIKQVQIGDKVRISTNGFKSHEVARGTVVWVGKSGSSKIELTEISRGYYRVGQSLSFNANGWYDTIILQQRGFAIGTGHRASVIN